MNWVEMSNKDRQFNRLARWARLAAMDDDGTVYLPAKGCDREIEVFLCACADGVQSVVSDGHLYVPAQWIAEHYPAAKEWVEQAERRVRECLAWGSHG